MSILTLPLSDPNATLEIVGGKGMSLAKMARAGLPVPGGFHITTVAYQQFVSENAIQPRILETLQDIDPASPDSLESASRQIAGFFSAGNIPAAVAEAITAEYARLKGAPVAVRSSATAEDLPGASFAGQQETYLNIRGEKAVLEVVKKCWASLWTARVIAYRARQAIPPESVALAVVVQELVNADAAGVLFAANPVTDRRGEMMITAAWGLGESIVGGSVTPDTILVEKAAGKVIRRETNQKQVMTVRTETGTLEQPVPEGSLPRKGHRDCSRAPRPAGI